MESEVDQGDAGSASAGDDVVRRPRSDVLRCPVCGVRLSAYNPGPNCWRHTIGHPWRGPSAKPRY